MKPTRGAYITFSELFDTRPTTVQLVALIQQMPLERALILLIRMNLSLRYVQEHSGQSLFGRLQGLFASNFLDKNTFQHLISRFGAMNADLRPLFISIHCLNMLRSVLLEATTLTPSELSDDQLRWHIGTGALMMSDLLLTQEEAQAIKEGTPDQRRLALMAQFLAPFELLNPPKVHRLAVRYQLMYRTVLRLEHVKRRIAKQCRDFDFDNTFKDAVGVSLDRWLHSVFAMHGYYQVSANPWDHHEAFLTIDRNNFVGKSDISQSDLDAVLNTIAGTLEQITHELRKEERTDPRFDFVPFRKKPLIQLTNGRLVCIDSSFLLEQVHVGVHWVMHDRLPSDKRDDLFQAWGILFEEYAHYLFEGMQTSLPIKYVRAPKWVTGPKDSVGQESFDGLFTKGTMLCPLEFKGGFLSRSSRYSGDPNLFISEMRKKFDGPSQLAGKIAALFSKERSDRRAIEQINADAYSVVLPILILQDHIFRVPLLNWWLNAQFRLEIAKYHLRPGLTIEPLTVMTINEMEGIVNAAESSNFDFLYVMRLRAIRDPEMRSELVDALFQFPDYGKQKSVRTMAAIDEWSKAMFGNLFPSEPFIDP